MTTSGTYAFNPSLAELVLSAYSRCGIRRTALLQEHFTDARMEANFLLGEWANKGINLWKIELEEFLLVQGQAEYVLTSDQILLLDAYIRTTNGDGTYNDRLIFPISRTDYASLANKQWQSPPTVFWFDRLITPKVTFWAVPDGSGPYTFRYYVMKQIEDAAMAGGLTTEIPYRGLDAFGWGLAERLAIIYAPDRVPMVSGKAKEAWAIFSGADVENTPLRVTPQFQGYFR